MTLSGSASRTRINSKCDRDTRRCHDEAKAIVARLAEDPPPPMPNFDGVGDIAAGDALVPGMNDKVMDDDVFGGEIIRASSTRQKQIATGQYKEFGFEGYDPPFEDLQGESLPSIEERSAMCKDWRSHYGKLTPLLYCVMSTWQVSRRAFRGVPCPSNCKKDGASTTATSTSKRVCKACFGKAATTTSRLSATLTLYDDSSESPRRGSGATNCPGMYSPSAKLVLDCE